MKLRAYEREDSPIIASWVRTEEELYKWSADRYGFFPLKDYSIDENYAPAIPTGRFIPLTGIDEEGKVVGHLIIRYPKEDDDSSVRFGFVIVDPELRGKGYGRELLKLAIEYVRNNLTAKRIDLGVFANNPKAQKCYESVGFKEFGEHFIDTPFGQWRCVDLEVYL